MKTRFYRCCVSTILFLSCSMNMHAQGTLWGLLTGGSDQYGVPGRKGVIINTNPDNTSSNSVAYNFKFDVTGGYPNYGSLLLAPNGKFYGLTSTGGANDFGVLFEYTPATNTYVDKFQFDQTSGKFPDGSLIVFNGKLYGMTTQGGTNNFGVIFEYDLITNTVITKYSFTSGNTPHGKLTVANNLLYGMTAKGGTAGGGTIFSYNPAANTFITHVNLSAATMGSSPYGSLTPANGKLYGMTKNGGSGGSFGVLFELDITATPHTYMVKQIFTGTAGTVPGANPYGDLTFVNNKLYGLTYAGGTSNAGVLFEYDVSGTGAYTVLKNLDATTGSHPYGNLLLASNGKLYGTTYDGGNPLAGLGVIFEYDLAGTYSQKYFTTFGYAQSSLAEANGSLFGFTTYGGISNSGVLFEYVISNKNLTKRIDFNTTLSGISPGTYSGLALDPVNGMLYGTTLFGGASSQGVLFQFDPATFTYTKMYDFNNASGYFCQAKLTWVGGAVNKFYGSTDSGGANNAGTIFEYDPSTNTYTKKADLQSVSGATIKGLTLASNGKLYGLASGLGLGNGSGAYTWGAIIEYNPGATTYSDKYDFTNTPNGANGVSPSGSLVELNGFLYGTTSAGGTGLSAGVIFSYNLTTGVYTKLYDLVAATGRGGNGLTVVNGRLYGTTGSGGANTFGGTIFSYDPVTNAFTDLHDFDANAGGENTPRGELVAVNNKLYGFTHDGGANSKGVVFEYDIATSTYAKKFDLTGFNGDQPYANSLLFMAGKLSQGIAFNPIPAKNFGDAAFSLNVTGGASGQTVTYSSSNPSVATVSATGIVTIVSAGSTDITASQIGNATYDASANVIRTLVVNPLPPLVNTTGTLTAFGTAMGTPSTAKSFTASGANLVANLVITPPAQFEVSLSSGSGYASTVSIVPTSGAVASTTIYIRYNPTAAGSTSGNIAVASFGASTKNVAASGTAVVLAGGITVTSAGNSNTITTNAGTLQMNAEVLPINATNSNVTWSIISGAPNATISSSGLLTAVANGTVTVKALATDGSGINGTKDITISGQGSTVLITDIIISGANNVSMINSVGGTLQMNAEVLPINATNSNVTWSIISGAANATISSSGLLTAVANGTVAVKALAADGSGISGTKDIIISGQGSTVLATGIIISGANNVSMINSAGGTLQMNAEVSPAGANQTVTWIVISNSGSATISSTGLLTALGNGTITVKASANDGSDVSGTLLITISGQNQNVLVSSITVTGTGNVSAINTAGGTLQMNAELVPANATNPAVIWSISNGSAATISSLGLLTATGNGIVTVKASANDGSNISGTKDITISGQTAAATTRIISLSGSLDFGYTIVGVDHPSKTFTITNNGTGTLVISAINVPTGFTLDKTSSAISPGQSMNVTLTFTPTTAMDYSGTLTVVSDATSGDDTLAVTAQGTLITALGDQGTIEGIEVYPNPSKGVFMLRMNDVSESASITGINGVTYYVKLQTIEKNLYKLDLTDKTDGVYILKCKSGKSGITIRLVKTQ